MKTPLKTDEEEDDVPPCFGKEWDRTEPDCRDRCSLFSSCGVQTTKAKVEALARQGVEVASLQGKVGPQVFPSLGETPAFFSAGMPIEPILSVPETVESGDTPWHVLGRSLLRGIGKSVSLTLAHFFDSVPFKFFRKR